MSPKASRCGVCYAMHNASMNKITLSLGILAGLLLADAARARPRDDVMSGAFRCAAIGDSRTWLDCYYGAAQPVRAGLGMKPVPPAQARLVAQPPSGTPTPGDLAVRDQVMNMAVRCSGESDEHQWLTCYYGAARPMRVHLGLESGASRPALQPIPPPQQPVPMRQASVPPTGFGARPLPVSPIGNVDHVSSPMRAYTFDKLGWFTVTLENGQVWQQVHGDTTYARWKKPPGNYLVRLSKGFLGSFNLQVKNEPGLFKVHRVE